MLIRMDSTLPNGNIIKGKVKQLSQEEIDEAQEAIGEVLKVGAIMTLEDSDGSEHLIPASIIKDTIFSFIYLDQP